MKKSEISPEKLPAALEKLVAVNWTLYTGEGFTKALIPVKIGESGHLLGYCGNCSEGVIGAEPTTKIVQVSIILGIVFIFIGIGMLYLVARSISRPIVTVTEMASPVCRWGYFNRPRGRPGR